MKTYLQILQLHAKVKDISYPNNLIKKDVKLPTVLWNRSLSSSTSTDDLGFTAPPVPVKPSADDTAQQSTANFWDCLFRKEDNGELGYEDNCVHFQLYFLISSMAYFYNEPIEKQISRKHLLIGQAVTNMFISNEVKAKLSDIFQKTQRTYLAFSRFANIVRHKINKEKIDFDLRMEPIDLRSKYSISLMHNGAKYYFVLTDLVNIIQTAITNSDDMFENPLFPKNPYNNLLFTKTQLYNIYFRIKNAFLNIPEWIQLFYNSGFDLDVFKVENEQKLREKYIKNYVNNGSIIVLNEEINSMISFYKRIFRRININEDFPKKDLVDVFRPYLFLYIMSIDGIEGIEKKQLSGIILKKKLTEFVSFNENFGRKIVSNQDCRRIVRFNMNHPHFTFKDACESFDKKKIFKLSSRNVIEEAPPSLAPLAPVVSRIEPYDNDSIVSSDEESSREEEFVYNYEYNTIPYDSGLIRSRETTPRLAPSVSESGTFGFLVPDRPLSYVSTTPPMAASQIPLRDLLRLNIYNELNHLVRGPIGSSTLQPEAAEGDLADEMVVNDADSFS